jgi:hypothetical protein
MFPLGDMTRSRYLFHQHTMSHGCLLLSFRHYSSLWWFILLLELITHLLHRHPLDAFMFVDVLDKSVYCQYTCYMSR